MAAFKKVTLIANPAKPKAAELRAEVAEFLKDKGVSISSDGEILITVGGDGTILYNKENSRKPIFGIGSATSFICQAIDVDWKERLSAVLEGKFEREERFMLACELNGKRLPDALNEVAVRNTEHRILTLRLGVDAKKYIFRADGILFSTPTGSSAYCYSCGGDELAPNTRAYEIVAIAPFRRSFEPLIVGEDAVSTLTVEAHCKWSVIIDGQFVYPFDYGVQELRVFKSERTVSFIKPVIKRK